MLLNPGAQSKGSQFDGERAYNDGLAQVAFGPRTNGSQAHADALEYIRSELGNAGWQVTIQNERISGHSVQNIIVRRSDTTPRLILGAHYDTRLFADRDPAPSRRTQPGPGANDDASGFAVLLELARILPNDTIPIQLVFFDAEDNGGLPGWDWLLGSRAFVASISEPPEAMILVDMVGDGDLAFPIEQNSDSGLSQSVWETAEGLGYGDIFLTQPGMRILDDHVPFIEAGIPAIDIIDLTCPYWHTSQDTPDKVFSKSLQIVGDTLLAWIEHQEP